MTRRKLLQTLWLAPAALLVGCAARGRPHIDPRIYQKDCLQIPGPVVAMQEVDDKLRITYEYKVEYEPTLVVTARNYSLCKS